MNIKSTIFLSHATPEDNDFTRWLAAKLTLAGYHVWYDLERLRGGDVSWDKIETAIRDESCRFVAIISRQSHEKDGVRKEWNLAANLEKKNRGFIVPVRIDNFNYDDVTILFSGKNIVDFNVNWFQGLSDLIRAFNDAHVPRVAAPDPVQASVWWRAGIDSPVDIDRSAEKLESSWIAISSLPHAVETTTKRVTVDQIALTDLNRTVPWFEHGTHVVTFAPRNLLIDMFRDQVPLAPGSAYSTDDLLRGYVKFDREVDAKEARNRVSFLVRQAWDLAMEKAGLIRHQLAVRQTVWYVPKGLSANDYFEFRDENGKKRRRQLVGRSEKYKVNWHYGVTIRPVLEPPFRIELRAHILFTGDLYEPVEPRKAHRLRRSFCRNWWNARWRDFQRAFLSYLSNDGGIVLDVGGGRTIKVSATPVSFVAPVRLTDATAQLNEETIVIDEEVKELDPVDDDIDEPDDEDAIA